jgi:hypothetical protein
MESVLSENGQDESCDRLVRGEKKFERTENCILQFERGLKPAAG